MNYHVRIDLIVQGINQREVYDKLTTLLTELGIDSDVVVEWCYSPDRSGRTSTPAPLDLPLNASRRDLLRILRQQVILS